MEKLGAVLVEISAIAGNTLPSLDALYVGGGFPETMAQSLAENATFRDALKQEIEKGLPVYAECGGLIYLGEQIRLSDNHYPMVGALPLDFVFHKKPQGHGYTILETCEQNPYYSVGKILKGHEFHYSRAILTAPKETMQYAFKVQRGHGIDNGKDGICRKNVLGTYTHVHAAGESGWAKGLIKAAIAYKKAAKPREDKKEHLTI